MVTFIFLWLHFSQSQNFDLFLFAYYYIFNLTIKTKSFFFFLFANKSAKPSLKNWNLHKTLGEKNVLFKNSFATFNAFRRRKIFNSKLLLQYLTHSGRLVHTRNNKLLSDCVQMQVPLKILSKIIRRQNVTYPAIISY